MKTNDDQWMVMAFMFSGRRNPQWTLTAEQAAEWLRVWDTAPRSLEEYDQRPRLGYTGCRLQKDTHSYWFIGDGCVSFYENDNVINRADAGKKLEHWLLNTAPGEVKDDLKKLGVL